MCSSGFCSKDHVTLEHDDPNLFDRSQVSAPVPFFDKLYFYYINWLQWCPPDRVSVWYFIYRILVALIFAAGISAQLVNSNLGLKWFIYMTDQGITFLFLHFLLDACLVTARFTWERSHPTYASCKLQTTVYILYYIPHLTCVKFRICKTFLKRICQYFETWKT